MINTIIKFNGNLNELFVNCIAELLFYSNDYVNIIIEEIIQFITIKPDHNYRGKELVIIKKKSNYFITFFIFKGSFSFISFSSPLASTLNL